MFKGHPKGLYVAFLANMGERFGFYTMMAILVLFLQARYDLTTESAGSIYSWFYFMIYLLALAGGILADSTKRYKMVILLGLVVMLAGYVFMAVPGLTQTVTVGALMVIAFGNGLFKGNLTAMVGKLYDDPKYDSLRDRAYSIFYMGINIGALFAPATAVGIRDWYLRSHGLGYDGSLPALSNKMIAGTLTDTSSFQALADQVTGGPVADLEAFARTYLDVFTTGYNYAFGIAAAAMILSLAIYVIFHKYLPGASLWKQEDSGKDNKKTVAAPQMSWEETKQRLIALGLVFAVVIFFWMAFHQNGLTMTYFARDYTVTSVGPAMFMVFNIGSVLCLGAIIYGLVALIRKGSGKTKLTGAGLILIGLIGAFLFLNSFEKENNISPEMFQQFNPLFIVLLTPVAVAFFGWLNKKGIEPSSPRKIGIGMLVTAGAFALIALASLGLPSQAALDGSIVPAVDRVSPMILIYTYLILTVAELLLSPMGLSFVSKVAPPRLQGFMQGGWLFATAMGNKLLFVGSLMYARIEVWQVWAVFVVLCLMAAMFMFSIMKRLERITYGA